MPSNRSQEGVEREGQRAVLRLACLLIATHELDVDVLVEGARKPIARVRKTRHRPPSAFV